MTPKSATSRSATLGSATLGSATLGAGTSIGAGTNEASARALELAATGLLADQSTDGFWCYEFEADCTITAEYVLLAHFTGEPQFIDEVAPDLEARLGNYLRNRQLADGGWPLYHGGACEVSCSVKAYYALKLLGDCPQAEHMVRAREAILARGGAVQSNVFTRITLALFGQMPWRAVPVVPVELILFPGWAPVHVSKVAYWSRTVTVPLSVLCSLKPRAANPRRVAIPELFVEPPQQAEPYFTAGSATNRVFLLLDAIARRYEPHVPPWLRKRALDGARAWILERANGRHGLGAIFPAMVNAYEAMVLLGLPARHPARVAAADALKRLLVVHRDEAYCQPCFSPIWDTGLSALALGEVGAAHRSGESRRALAATEKHPAPNPRRLELSAALALDAPTFSGRRRAPAPALARSSSAPPSAVSRTPQEAVIAGLDWAAARQLWDEPGDWQAQRPDLPGGGWAFEFANSHYPDVDDTAVLGWAMLKADPDRYRCQIERAAVWTAGMQSSNGGFAAFDVDNCHDYLNEVPFADHGALLDPPSSDVTARCVAFLAAYDAVRFEPVIARALEFLAREREPEGCWFGRWGTNYIYGTWSVLVALEALGDVWAVAHPGLDRWAEAGAAWLQRCQRQDGGWGESNDSYHDRSLMGCASTSTAFHTAWAMLGLMATRCAEPEVLERGAAFLCATQGEDGLWHDQAFTCPGFPRVFYLKYHGYSKYFPAWALARYRADKMGPRVEKRAD